MDNLKRMFQYISCYSLSNHGLLHPETPGNVSIHLMLLFIEIGNTKEKLALRFNTSHVTLYQDQVRLLRKPVPFQYISCYSLSGNGMVTKMKQEMFQYISCYSLS